MISCEHSSVESQHAWLKISLLMSTLNLGLLCPRRVAPIVLSPLTTQNAGQHHQSGGCHGRPSHNIQEAAKGTKFSHSSQIHAWQHAQRMVMKTISRYVGTKVVPHRPDLHVQQPEVRMVAGTEPACCKRAPAAACDLVRPASASLVIMLIRVPSRSLPLSAPLPSLLPQA